MRFRNGFLARSSPSRASRRHLTEGTAQRKTANALVVAAVRVWIALANGFAPLDRPPGTVLVASADRPSTKP
jgi:hypothetical protein